MGVYILTQCPHCNGDLSTLAGGISRQAWVSSKVFVILALLYPPVAPRQYHSVTAGELAQEIWMSGGISTVMTHERILVNVYGDFLTATTPDGRIWTF